MGRALTHGQKRPSPSQYKATKPTSVRDAGIATQVSFRYRITIEDYHWPLTHPIYWSPWFSLSGSLKHWTPLLPLTFFRLSASVMLFSSGFPLTLRLHSVLAPCTSSSYPPALPMLCPWLSFLYPSTCSQPSRCSSPGCPK